MPQRGGWHARPPSILIHICEVFMYVKYVVHSTHCHAKDLFYYSSLYLFIWTRKMQSNDSSMDRSLAHTSVTNIKIVVKNTGSWIVLKKWMHLLAGYVYERHCSFKICVLYIWRGLLFLTGPKSQTKHIKSTLWNSCICKYSIFLAVVDASETIDNTNWIIFIRITWYDMIWYDMIWYDVIWYDMIWYDISTVVL